MRTGRSRGLLGWLFLPGVVIHELAHALTVVVLPGISLVEVDLTRHVRHEGQYTVTRSFLISYAPLVVNTGVTAVCALALARLDPTASASHAAAGVGLAYLAVVAGLRAFPSYRDATNPVRLLRQQVASRPLVLIPAAPVVLAVATPGIVLTYLFRRSPYTRLLVSAAYVALVGGVGLGLLAVPDPQGVVSGVAAVAR